MKRASFGEERPRYEGPWQLGFIRDVDPSFLLKTTARSDHLASEPSWWFPVCFSSWDCANDEGAWLRRTDDIPSPERLISIRGGEPDRDWLALEGSYGWSEPAPPGFGRWDTRHGQLWCHVWSYVVRRDDMDVFLDWALGEYWFGHPPQSHEWISAFMGEFFWAPAFAHYDTSYNGRPGWTRGVDRPFPTEAVVSTDQYFHEHAGDDFSIDDTINIYVPGKWLTEQMGLCWSGKEGVFEDPSQVPVAIDPSVTEKGPSALLIDRQRLLDFCSAEGYGVVWVLAGEKHQVGGNREDYKGTLQFSGAYKVAGEGSVVGDLNARLMTVGPTYEEIKEARKRQTRGGRKAKWLSSPAKRRKRRGRNR